MRSFAKVVMGLSICLAYPGLVPAGTPDLASCDEWRLACSGNYTNASRPSSHPINYVVIHKVQGTASSAASWFQNCSSNVSAHYTFNNSSGYCYQSVYEADIAFHAGNWTYNTQSIGIEHGGYVTSNDTATVCYNKSALETKSCIIYYSVLHNRNRIVGHSEVPGASHTDPGVYWNWTYYMSKCNPSATTAFGLTGPSLFYKTGAGTMNIYRWSPSGSSFATLGVSSLGPGYDLDQVGQHMVSADVDADGDSDNVVAYQYQDGTIRLHVFKNGNSYAGNTGWFQSGTFNLANVNGRMLGGDFNGDGKGDVAMMYDNGSGVTLFRFISNGSSFAYDSASLSSGYGVEMVDDNVAASDVNADGKTDIVAAYQYPDGTMRLHVFLNGNSYTGDTGWFQSGQFDLANVNGRMVGGDFNGDGRGDVALMYDNGSGITIFRFKSTGAAFTYDTGLIQTGYDTAAIENHVAAGDVDNDGDTDLVAAYQYLDGTFRYHVFKEGINYQGPAGWYQSGAFDLANVSGRMTMGNW